MSNATQSLLKQVITSFQTRARQGTSHTKSRGDVSGGGRKPWKQKGTGRARAGSSRSPIWSGGGVAHGPQKNSNHTPTITKRMKRTALKMMIDLLRESSKIGTFPAELKFTKTRDAVAWLKERKLTGKHILFILDKPSPSLLLTTRNIPHVEVISLNNLFLPHLTHQDFVFAPSSLLDRSSPKLGAKKAKNVSQKTEDPL